MPKKKKKKILHSKGEDTKSLQVLTLPENLLQFKITSPAGNGSLHSGLLQQQGMSYIFFNLHKNTKHIQCLNAFMFFIDTSSTNCTSRVNLFQISVLFSPCVVV